MLFSIHAPREGSDVSHFRPFRIPQLFNPRSPRGERPAQPQPTLTRWHFSIHAPREGSDLKMPQMQTHTEFFNPRSPRGERRGG